MANAGLESTNRLSERILSSTGSIQLLNSHGEECILAFTPVDDTSGWTLISIVPANDLNVDKNDWLLFGVVSAGLLILFLIDMIYLQSLNKRLQITAREAESTSKVKTDFLSTMSHDIRTPMDAISTALRSNMPRTCLILPSALIWTASVPISFLTLTMALSRWCRYSPTPTACS